ncbi:Pr6Pr family membrane protein [Microbacterium sp. UFMG61]|uniref:Pr6Pr family membrane protein n=1 Tax=Microbacterium sp. UFMG61 TaxID=2745935 RepID=UPI00188F092C|nr:Pr6Pr family membrane protein [Microbacterium sp. UFMG61]
MTSTPPPSRTVSTVRVVVGASVTGILLYTYVIGIPRQGASLFDYFGYFTNLTSLLTAIVMMTVGTLALRRRRVPAWLVTSRAVSVASMIVVALVYNLIVPGTGSAPAWVSTILHVALPLLLLIDWAFVPDRGPQPWRSLWAVLTYPLLWLVVVLFRGRTDGWVPYGFLLPERGTLMLAITVVALLATLLASATLVWGLSRVRVARRFPESAGSQAVAQP